MGPVLMMQLVCLGASIAAGAYALWAAKRQHDLLQAAKTIHRAYTGLVEDVMRMRERP